MQPIQKFDWIFHHFITKLATFIGLPVLDPNMKFNFATFCNISGAFSFLVCFLWMLGTRDLMTVLKASTCMGLCVQGLTKFFTYYLGHRNFYELVSFLRGIYAANRSIDTGNYHILQRWSQYGVRLCRVFLFLSICIGVVILSAPAIQYWLTGTCDTLLPIFVPLTDENTTTGYAINTVYLTYMVSLGVVGSLSSDSMQLMIVIHMWPMCLVFENMVGQLNEAVGREWIAQSIEVRRYVRNILMVHQRICRYNRVVADQYYVLSTVEIYSNAAGLCTCIFCLFSAHWPPVFMLILMQVVKLLACCLLGTIAELASDRILSALIASNWYLLPVDEQRKFQFMMNCAQQPVVLKAGVLPLNLNLFVNVMKTIYTVSMLLSETIN